jgi:RNA polymerase sigma-70 factor, ECF subfamily
MAKTVNELAACTDDELVLRAQACDEAAFAELMRRTSPTCMRLAMSILRDRQDAEDELQNSYFNAWRHVSQFERESKFSTWMSRIVVNHCLMRLRKLRSKRFVYLDDVDTEERTRPLEIADSCETPEASLGANEVSAMLEREIHRLPPVLREVEVLRDLQGLSSQETAEKLKMSVPAVKSRLLRARAELRNRLEKHTGRAGVATLTS